MNEHERDEKSLAAALQGARIVDVHFLNQQNGNWMAVPDFLCPPSVVVERLIRDVQRDGPNE